MIPNIPRPLVFLLYFVVLGIFFLAVNLYSRSKELDFYEMEPEAVLQEPQFDQHSRYLLLVIHVYNEERLTNLESTWLGILRTVPGVSVFTFSSTYRGVDYYLPPIKDDSKLCPSCKPSVNNRRKLKKVWRLLASKPFFNSFEWYYKLDDDVYVFPENLLKFLEERDVISKNHNLFYGYLWRSEDQDLPNRKNVPGLNFPSGGCGWILNRNSLRVLNREVLSAPLLPVVTHDFAKKSASDDVLFGFWMDWVGIELIHASQLFIEEPDAYLVFMYVEHYTRGRLHLKPFFDVDHIAFHHVRDLEDFSPSGTIPKTIFQFFPHSVSGLHTSFMERGWIKLSYVKLDSYLDAEEFLIQNHRFRRKNNNAFDFFHSYENDFFRKVKEFFNFSGNLRDEMVLSYLFVFTFGGVVFRSDFKFWSVAGFKEQLLEMIQITEDSDEKECFFVIHGDLGIIAMGCKPRSFAAFSLFKELHFVEEASDSKYRDFGVGFLDYVIKKRQADVGDRVIKFATGDDVQFEKQRLDEKDLMSGEDFYVPWASEKGKKL